MEGTVVTDKKGRTWYVQSSAEKWQDRREFARMIIYAIIGMLVGVGICTIAGWTGADLNNPDNLWPPLVMMLSMFGGLMRGVWRNQKDRA